MWRSQFEATITYYFVPEFIVQILLHWWLFARRYAVVLEPCSTTVSAFKLLYVSFNPHLDPCLTSGRICCIGWHVGISKCNVSSKVLQLCWRRLLLKLLFEVSPHINSTEKSPVNVENTLRSHHNWLFRARIHRTGIASFLVVCSQVRHCVGALQYHCVAMWIVFRPKDIFIFRWISHTHNFQSHNFKNHDDRNVRFKHSNFIIYVHSVFCYISTKRHLWT